MEYWYKTQLPATADNLNKIKSHLHQTLEQSNRFGIANLYEDGNDIYVKTINNIVLHSFLFRFGFVEAELSDENVDEKDLNLVYGQMD